MKERQWFEVDWAEAQRRSRKIRIRKAENAPGGSEKSTSGGRTTGQKVTRNLLGQKSFGRLWKWCVKYGEWV